MKLGITALALAIAAVSGALGQSAGFPATVEAGTSFSVPTAGSGPAQLYVIGPGGAIRRKIPLGTVVYFAAGDLTAAGHYVGFLVSGSRTQSFAFDVTPSREIRSLSFLAKPSRLPVNLPQGLSGVVYGFDVFHNLVMQPQSVTFTITDGAGRAESRAAVTSNGVAWVRMNSAVKPGPAGFQAVAGSISEKRVVQQVPGDPCAIKMTARKNGQRITLETSPVHDCNGNPVPDGTIVTFTETDRDGQSTVDVPLKRGVARTEMPSASGAVISVASGVVMGNEIHWGGGL